MDSARGVCQGGFGHQHHGDRRAVADGEAASRPARPDPASTQPHLLEANEAVQKLLFKAQVDVNELTGEQDPVVRLIDFTEPEKNQFHAVNQFRIDSPGCVKQFIIPDIVLFVNGIPLVMVECKKGGPTCANPTYEALQESIGSIDYWTNADKQKKTRSEIKPALMLTGIEELKQNRERVAVEIMKMAKNRHDELLKGSK